MGSSRLTLKRSVLLSTVALLSVLSTPAFGQDPAVSSAPAPAPAPAPAASTESVAPAPQASTTAPQVSTSAAPPATLPSTSAAPPSTSSAAAPPAQSSSSSSTTSNGPRPSISATGPQQANTDAPPPLPTLDNPAGIPNYPPPTVPPTGKAPFMNRSTMPDGTVFIAVGAILAAFAVAVIAWRGIVACLLHRSVQRAAHEQHVANDKAAFSTPGVLGGGGGGAVAPFYKYNDKESSASLAAMGVRRSNRGPTPSATPSQTNLFFSPTAPGATGMGGGGGRDSRFLPSGFYAAGGSNSPGGGSGVGGGAYGHGHSISLTNLRPDSRAHSRAMGPTPPDSPSLGPSRATPPVQVQQRNVSTTSLSLNRPPSGRAPSAYLDDLLDDHGPGAFPPPGVPGAPNHHHSYSSSTQGGGQPSRPY